MIPLITAIARCFIPGFIRLRISPNTITGLSLLSGVLAGWVLARGTGPALILGAFLFLLANVLDECDGVVARQTDSCTPLGATLDTFADCVVHAAFFVGLGAAMAAQMPQGPWVALGWTAAAGGILSCALDVVGITPWQAPDHSDKTRERSLAWVVEWFRIDFSVIVMISALVGHASWILWAGALGVFLFWIPSTFVIAVQGRRKS